MAREADVVHELYVTGAEVRPSFRETEAEARSYYARYAAFVDANAPCRPARILDVGCGGGWSTLLLREHGHQAEGLDLHEEGLEAASVLPDLRYTQGDAQALPFPDGAFDVVSMYQVLEHVPEPRRALEECIRILRPGGRIVIVGPNLLSFPVNLYWALRSTASLVARGRLWESRTPDLPRHPGGNTMPETWASTGRHFVWTLQKLAGERQPNFRMRVPDTRPPFHADNDACYLCNPMDLVNWAKSETRVKAHSWWASDRAFARTIWPFTGGTWVVLEKLG